MMTLLDDLFRDYRWSTSLEGLGPVQCTIVHGSYYQRKGTFVPR